jgi:hypothetical protein
MPCGYSKATEDFPITALCTVMQVNTSAFYSWANKAPDSTAQKTQQK